MLLGNLSSLRRIKLLKTREINVITIALTDRKVLNKNQTLVKKIKK